MDSRHRGNPHPAPSSAEEALGKRRRVNPYPVNNCWAHEEDSELRQLINAAHEALHAIRDLEEQEQLKYEIDEQLKLSFIPI